MTAEPLLPFLIFFPPPMTLGGSSHSESAAGNAEMRTLACFINCLISCCLFFRAVLLSFFWAFSQKEMMEVFFVVVVVIVIATSLALLSLGPLLHLFKLS